MKKILQSLSIIALAGLFLQSCSKEYKPLDNPDNLTTPNPFLGELTCTFWGGDGYIANEKVVSDTYDENGVRSLSIFSKQYSDSLDANVYRIVNINIVNFNGPGDYNVGAGTSNSVIISYDEGQIHTFNQINNLPEMVVHVSQADGSTYQGTFNFMAKNINDTTTISVTNGSFNLTK